jgi:hypothetical protein
MKKTDNARCYQIYNLLHQNIKKYKTGILEILCMSNFRIGIMNAEELNRKAKQLS